MQNTFAIPMRNILDNGKKLPKKLFMDLKRYILGSEFRSLTSLEEQIIFLKKCFISLTVVQITTLLEISIFQFYEIQKDKNSNEKNWSLSNSSPPYHGLLLINEQIELGMSIIPQNIEKGTPWGSNLIPIHSVE